MSVRALTLLITVVALITLPISASANTSVPNKTLPIRTEVVKRQEASQKQQKVISSERATQASLNAVRNNIEALRHSTWKCQDALGVKRTNAGASLWALGPSLAYRKWVAKQWARHDKQCQRVLALHRIPSTWDWLSDVRLVQRIYPGTADWLLFISHREGGWGRFVMNSQGSGAGGWLQFMSSTYYAYNDAAYADARSRGFIIDESTNNWTHPLGQAITGAYMRYTHLDACHWCL